MIFTSRRLRQPYASRVTEVDRRRRARRGLGDEDKTTRLGKGSPADEEDSVRRMPLINIKIGYRADTGDSGGSGIADDVKPDR